jgi:hypothetical protein
MDSRPLLASFPTTRLMSELRVIGLILVDGYLRARNDHWV